MKKILEVPHLTQYYDIEDSFWRGRSCGIVSLAMILDYYGVKYILEELIKRGVAIDHYDPAIGWKHQTIVDLAEEYGFFASRVEDERVENLTVVLDQNEPAIISIHKNWNPKNEGHLVVLNGYFESDGELEGFYVCDPIGASYKNKNQFIPLKKFLLGWKKRAIYVKKG